MNIYPKFQKKKERKGNEPAVCGARLQNNVNGWHTETAMNSIQTQLELQYARYAMDGDSSRVMAVELNYTTINLDVDHFEG